MSSPIQDSPQKQRFPQVECEIRFDVGSYVNCNIRGGLTSEKLIYPDLIFVMMSGPWWGWGRLIN